MANKPITDQFWRIRLNKPQAPERRHGPAGSRQPGTDMDIRIFAEPQLGASYDEQLAVAKAVERLGFGGFFRADHLMREGSFTRQAGPTDVWVTLAGLARETTRIRLGSLMSCSTFRNPAHLAITVGQLDAMSHGRIEFGL